MRKYIVLVLILVCVLSLIGCSQQAATDQDTQKNSTIEREENTELETAEPNMPIPAFSYGEDSAIYVEGEPGVKTSGFLNTARADAELDLDRVAELAEKECTVEWDCCTVYLDTAACIWKAAFSTTGTAGGGQTVYLDYEGKTVLIVYGE